MNVQTDDAVLDDPEALAEEETEIPGDEASGEAGDAPPEGEGDAVVVTIGDEPAEPEAGSFEDEDTGVVKSLTPEQLSAFVRMRQQKAAATRRARELEQQVKAKEVAPAAQAPVVVGEEPTFEGCEYDPDKFKAELNAWTNRKRAAEEQENKRKAAEEASQASWKQTLSSYEKQKTSLKVQDYSDAESTARDALNVTQQGVILSGTDNPALVIYALGKNPKVLKELSSITDPVKFAVRIGKLEKDLKVTPRKAAPIPERVVKGSGGAGAATDSTLEKLRAEADRTGDRTKVAAYMRQLQAKAKA